MPLILFAITRKLLLNKDIDIFFIRGEAIMVLLLFFHPIFLPLFFYPSLFT